MANIFRYLTDDGLTADGTNLEMAGTADKYYMGPADGEYWVLHRMMIYIEDNATMNVSEYGGGLALVNGVDVYTTGGGPDGPIITRLNCNEPIHTNGEWAGICYDVSFESPGAGNNVLRARWTFSRSGKPVILDGNNNEKLVMNIQDDLSGLVSHRAFVNGYSTDTLTGRE